MAWTDVLIDKFSEDMKESREGPAKVRAKKVLTGVEKLSLEIQRLRKEVEKIKRAGDSEGLPKLRT